MLALTATGMALGVTGAWVHCGLPLWPLAFRRSKPAVRATPPKAEAYQGRHRKDGVSTAERHKGRHCPREGGVSTLEWAEYNYRRLQEDIAARRRAYAHLSLRAA